jgi:hypothetical protein
MQHVATVAFEGIEARAVDVQVQVVPGLPNFIIVGLPDKAVSEARERVRAALTASGLALPARRIIVNLAPADLPKEGSHYDLPIALGLMATIGAIPHDALAGFTVLGELGLDGSLAPVAGVLPAAIGANVRDEGLICPVACGAEAIADPDRQSLQRHPGAIAAAAEGADPRGLTARSPGHQGPGERQACIGNCSGWRSSSPDDGIARFRQIHARRAAAIDPAAAGAG